MCGAVIWFVVNDFLGREPFAWFLREPPVVTRDRAPTRVEEPSLEYKLAAIDRRGAVTPRDPIVARYRSLLDKLAGKWMNTTKTIADATVAGQNSLREKGISESVLNIMDGVNEAPDTPYLNYRYGEHVAMYVTLRAHGRSHAAAVGGLRDALQGLTLQ